MREKRKQRLVKKEGKKLKETIFLGDVDKAQEGRRRGVSPNTNFPGRDECTPNVELPGAGS